MSQKRFLSILQALLTMADPNDPDNVSQIKTALESIWRLASKSNQCDSITLRTILNAKESIDHLLKYRKDFISVKGDRFGSAAHLDQLRLVLTPGC